MLILYHGVGDSGGILTKIGRENLSLSIMFLQSTTHCFRIFSGKSLRQRLKCHDALEKLYVSSFATLFNVLSFLNE